MGRLAKIRSELTAKKKTAFLKAFKANHGNTSRACKVIDTTRQTIYDWRAGDDAFAAAMDEILIETGEDLEQEAYRRAHDGIDKPVYQGKELVGYIREYSDTLLIFMLKARFPQRYVQVQRVAATNPEGTEAAPFVIALPEGWGSAGDAAGGSAGADSDGVEHTGA